MDKTDREIIKLICDDARLTPALIASALSITEKEAKERIRKAEECGAIVKYTAIVGEEFYGEDNVEALIEVKVTPRKGSGFDKIAEEISAHGEVVNLYLMSGAYDLAVIVRGRSLREVSRFVSEKISTYDSVISTATHFILKKYKIEGANLKSGAPERLSVQP